MSPEPKDSQPKPELKSLEELTDAQKKFEEQKAVEAKRQEEEKAAREAAQAKAGEEHTKRKELMGDYDILREDVMKMEAAGIKERIEKTERLRESEQAKARELQESEAELAEVKEYLSGLSFLIEGKGEGDISPEIQEALKTAKTNEAEISGKLKTMGTELKAVQVEMVSPEELSRYQAAKTKMHELVAEIHRIDSDPFVRERFLKEAKGERDLRNGIIREAKSLARVWGETPRSELVEKVCNSFLSEEFRARGIDAMTDSEERLRIMREFSDGLLVGLHTGVDSFQLPHIPEEKKRQDMYVGVLLKNFIGTHGTVDGSLGFLRMAELGQSPYRDPEVGKEAINDQLQKHLGTINLLRSYSFGVKDHDHKREIVPRFENWQGFDRDLYNSDFIAEFDGPIVPKKAEAGVKEMVAKEFNENKRKAQEIEARLEARLTREKEEELLKQIADLEKRISEREAILKQVQEAEAVIEREDYKLPWDQRLKQKLESAPREIRALEKELDNMQSDLADLEQRWFKGKEKSQLRENIARKERQLREKQRELEELREREKRYQEALDIREKNGFVYGISNQLAPMKRRLEELKEQLSYLKSKDQKR